MNYAYQPLLDHIATSTASQIKMSYAEIEKILGRRLPPSARNVKVKRQWWANTETHSQAKAWMINGRKAKLDVHNDMVTFYRDLMVAEKVPHGAPSEGSEIRLQRSSLQPATVRLIEDYIEENRVDFAQATADLLNQAARRHRREALDWFARNTTVSSVPGSELIRQDRDAR